MPTVFLDSICVTVFTLPCILSSSVSVPLYFVLRPEVFQLVGQQPLTQAVRLFSTVQHPVIQSVLVSDCSLPFLQSIVNKAVPLSC